MDTIVFMTRKIRDQNPVAMRIPDEIKDLLTEAVKKHKSLMGGKRSMNTEIVERLDASFKPPVDLSQVPTADLVRELIRRNAPGKICIEVSKPKE
jgi:hypothetical protein